MSEKDSDRPVRSFLFAPLFVAGAVAVAVLLAALLAQSLLWRHAIRELSQDQLASLDRDAFLLDARVRRTVNDIFFLKSVAEAEEVHDPNAGIASLNLRTAARTMMQARGQYDQMHLLDLAGHEIFRYNWKGDGKPLEDVPEAQLQNKSDRPYYHETLESPANAAVFSRLDLNVEHGRIEQPLKPVLRISGQIVGTDGKPRALLVLNQLGDPLLREIIKKTDVPRRKLLVSSDGYWIVGPTPESEWGFMFPGKEGENLKVQDPPLWAKITAKKAGAFEDQGRLITFQEIDPLSSEHEYATLQMAVIGSDHVRWILLEETPNDMVWQKVQGIRTGLWIACGVAMLFLVPVVGFGVFSLQRRRRAVREVRLARTLLDSVIKASPHGVVVLEAIRDENGHIADMRLLLANQLAGELLGEDLVRVRQGDEKLLANHPEIVTDGTFAIFTGVVETGDPTTFEYPYRWGDLRRWLSISCAKRGDGLVMTIVDMTHRREMEEKLRQNENLLKLAGSLARMGAWTVEYPDLRVSWTEELYFIHEESLDHPPAIETGLNYYAEESRAGIRRALENCAETGTPFDLESALITAKGNRIWVRLMGRAEFIDGELRRVFGIVQDITSFKKAAEALRQSQDSLTAALAQAQELTRRAQSAERAKSEFLAMMSHEIRTPMNGVIGMIDILTDTELNDLQRDCAHTIQASGEALLTVINDILDFSKIESGMMNLEQTPFGLRQCVEEAIDLFAPVIRQKRLEAAYLIAPDVPSNLLGDSTRLRQILTNLLGNAIKFTERGEITLNIECQKRDSAGCHLQFSVTDTGIGIPPEAINRLFQSFQQVDSSTTRRYGGTGLGLVISKNLAELMGGTMWAESQPGVGSTFFFTAVMAAAPTHGSIDLSPPAPPSKSSSVLIVDDNATNRRILEIQLKAWGMNPVAVSSGAAALQKLEETSFDAALVDLQMPDMDGVALARELQRRASLPLILLSSLGEVEVGEAASLFQAQISKPIKQSLLFDALQQILNGTARARKTTATQFDPSIAARLPLRILLAEDNAVNQKVMQLMLGKMGYHADIAANGFEVLAMAEKSEHDVIFMDIQMPEMDGSEACRRLHEKMGSTCPLIVALTANALEGDQEKFLAQGFDNYLKKPLGLAQLYHMLEYAAGHKGVRIASS